MESRAADIKTECLKDITLKSVAGKVGIVEIIQILVMDYIHFDYC